MRSSIMRNAKAISIIAGFLFGTLGAAWSVFIDDRLNDEMRQLSDIKADLRIQIDSLNSVASDYFITDQQGNLIFLMANQENAPQDLAALMYQGNLLDRAIPVRNMIAALALGQELDYQQTYDAYEKLNDVTRANSSFENYRKLKEFEKSIILQGQERIPKLFNDLFEVEKAINANQAAQQKNRAIGLLSSIFGNLLLLAANLVTEGKKRDEGRRNLPPAA